MTISFKRILYQLLTSAAMLVSLAGLWTVSGDNSLPEKSCEDVVVEDDPEAVLSSDDLWALLEDPLTDSLSRYQAGGQLAKRGSGIVPRLKVNLASRDAPTRKACLRLLFENPSLVRQVVSEVLALRNDAQFAIGRDALVLMGRAKISDPQTIEILFEVLKSRKELVADAAAESLAQVHRPTHVPRILEAIEGGNDWQRQLLTGGLCTTAKTDPRSVEKALRKRLARKDVLPPGLWTTTMSSSTPLMSQLIRALPRDYQLSIARQYNRHPNPAVRGELALAALKVAPQLANEFAPALREAIVGSKADPRQMERLMTGGCRPGVLVPKSILAPLVACPDPMVRIAAARNSGPKVGDKALVDPLIEGLATDRKDLFLSALGEVGPAAARAIPVVEKIAESDPRHRDDCDRCLERLRGLPLISDSTQRKS